MLRIANWDYNCVRATEGLDVELFQKSYGNVVGTHYYGSGANSSSTSLR